MPDTSLWWGYLHSAGTYQVKRYFGPLDIQEANKSPFCVKIAGPFDALDRMDALVKLKELTD